MLRAGAGPENVGRYVSTSTRPQPLTAEALALLSPEVHDLVLGLHAGALGRTVRCTPRRRTVRVAGSPALFGKWRTGGRADAAREWHWLHVLPLVGLRTPRPVAWLGHPRRSVLVTEAVAGRPMDVWIAEAAEQGWLEQLGRYAVEFVAPAVQCLHRGGLVYRDLYWNHLFVTDPRTSAEPVFLDVERVFRPRWRWRRWVVKDLAGLLASAPVAIPLSLQLRFMRRYGGGEPLDRRLLRAIARKAARIRRHVPRFG